MLLRELRPLSIHVDVELFGDGLQHSREVLGMGRTPRRDRALIEREIRIGDDQIRIDFETRPQTETSFTGAIGAVERKIARCELLETRAAFRASHVLRKGDDFACTSVCAHQLDGSDTVGQLERSLQTVRQSALNRCLAHQAVHHDVDVVLLVAGQLRVALEKLGNVHGFAIDLRASESLRDQVGEHRLVLTFATPHDGSQDLESSSLRKFLDLVDDLLRSLPGQWRVVFPTVLNADPRPQQPEIVVDLGDRADRRTWILGGRLLIDRDRGRQSFDDVHVGLVHLSEELSRIGTQGLDITPLTLGIDGVEGETALPRTR